MAFTILHAILNREAFLESSNLHTTIIMPIYLPAIIFLDPLIAGSYAFLYETFALWKKTDKLKLVLNSSLNAFILMFLTYVYQYVINISQFDISSVAFFLFVLLAGTLCTFLSNLLSLIAYSLQSKKLDPRVMSSFFSSLKTSWLTIFLGVINVFIFNYFGLVGITISTFLMIFIKPVINFHSILNNELSTFTDFVLHIIKLYDPITHAHSERVKKWTVLIAKEMKLSSKEIHELSQAASWHDIGKIEIPNYIINKTGKLTDKEYELVKEHPEIGYQLVKDMHFFKDYLPVIRYHHERMDGRGYPLGLSGKDIPLHARIMCVADSFDAMTSKRSYKKGMTMKEAVEELKRCSGDQFDPEIVEIFIRALEKLYGPSFEEWDKPIANHESLETVPEANKDHSDGHNRSS